MHALTGVQDSSKHPALGVADRVSGFGILQKDLDAARPRCRGPAHRVVVTPVPDTHAIIVLSINLRGREMSGNHQRHSLGDQNV